MTITKEYYPKFGEEYHPNFKESITRFILIRNDYDNRFSAILELVNEAKKDFPNLGDINIDIAYYVIENQYKHKLGIEFSLINQEPPNDDYILVNHLRPQI